MKVRTYIFIFFGIAFVIIHLNIMFAWLTTYEVTRDSHIYLNKRETIAFRRLGMLKNQEYTFTIESYEDKPFHIAAQYDENVMSISFNIQEIQPHQKVKMFVIFKSEMNCGEVKILTDHEDLGLTIRMVKSNALGEWLHRH